MKKVILFLIIIFVILNNVYSSENIINNIFFEDFKEIAIKISDNFFASVAFFSAASFATLTLINNDSFIKSKVELSENDFNDKFFDYINYGGDAIYVMALNSLFFLFSEKEKRTGKNMIECFAVNGIINYSLKIILGRKRPSRTENPRDFDFFTFSDNSMPSGHTLVAFTWAEVLNNSYGIWYITYPVASLVGYARVYKNSHWVSDVFLGGILGVVLTRIILSKNDDLQIALNYDNRLSKVFIKYDF